jgi:hypothetical protein
MMWFVISLGLFGGDSYRQIFRWLHRFRPRIIPGRSTLCEARKSLGIAPLRRLANEVIQLQGRPNIPHAFYGDMRLMAVDGFVLDVADTPENERVFGRPGSGRSPGAFPQVRVLSLCEAGTHVLWRSLIKPCTCGEVPMARPLLRFLEENMLLLWDRGFLSYDLVHDVRQRRAHLLARAKKNLVLCRSRDEWKAECKEAKRENKSLKYRLAAMTQSRDRGKADVRGLRNRTPAEAEPAVGEPPRNRGGGGRKFSHLVP